jgi:two-component system, cell cycle sensor histidine kinase and response regulator CckA
MAERVYRVLVVDDQREIRDVVDRVLRAAGYESTLAASGPDALELLEAGVATDLLLTDLRMPDMNGDELARHACQLRPDLKVLYLTGYADDLFTAGPTLRDNEAFVEKPVTPTGLEEAVALVLFGSTRRPDQPGAKP